MKQAGSSSNNYRWRLRRGAPFVGSVRPRQLDDHRGAGHPSLMREMELEGRGIVSHLEWRIDESALRKPARDAVSCLREGLNNIVNMLMPAVTLQGWQQDERLMLVIEDDGSGLPPGSATRFWPHRNARARNGAGWHITHFVCTARVSAFLYLNAMSKV